VSALGYRIEFTSQPAAGPRQQRMDTLDARDSIGMSLSDGGQVGTVQLGSPADEAGLAPRMRIIGVGEHVFSRQRFLDALEQSPVTGEVRLLMTSGDRIVERVIKYDGGPRYMTLVREHDKPDVLGEILKPR
jgi:predicted metalloprotease with PDZ domain